MRVFRGPLSQYKLPYRDLPQELLDIIFANLLQFPVGVKFRRVHRLDGEMVDWFPSAPLTDLSVLFLNRDMYNKNSRVFYSANEFSFGYEGIIEKDLAVFPREASNWIRTMHISALEMRTDGPQTASLVLVNKMMDQMRGLKAVSIDIDLQPSTNRAGHPKRNPPFLMILNLLQRLLSCRIDGIRLILNHCVGKRQSPENLHTVRVLRAFDFSDTSIKNWRQAIGVWYKDAKLSPIPNSKLSQSQSDFSVIWVNCQNDYQDCKQHPQFHKACKTDRAVLLGRPGLTPSASHDGAEKTNETLGLDKPLLNQPAPS